MNEIKLLDKDFEIFISRKEIEKKVKNLADKINKDYKDQEVIFLSILNGSFMFAADFLKHISIDCKLSFVKLASYNGVRSSGDVQKLIGLEENICGKNVIVIEDIIDTGLTLDSIVEMLNEKGPASIKIATLLYKPDAYCAKWSIDYIGWEIENRFVVGYGMDFKGLGRNFQDIYKLKN